MQDVGAEIKVSTELLHSVSKWLRKDANFHVGPLSCENQTLLILYNTNAT